MLRKALSALQLIFLAGNLGSEGKSLSPPVLLDKVWINSCSVEEGCSQVVAPNDSKYSPYLIDATGKRIPDRLDIQWRKNNLYMTLNRPARVSVCLVNRLHRYSTPIDEKIIEEGWNLYPGLEEGSVKRVPGQGRVRTPGGLANCGLTIYKDFFDRKPGVMIPAIKMKTAVLLEELEGGRTSLTPLPVLGDSSREMPQPNELCPEWIHDEYYTNRDYRDGNVYRTWHPQFHPIYWCSLGHDHGSDPSLLGMVTYPDGQVREYKPSLGFVAFYNDQQNEPNIGFKGYVIKGEEVNLYINAHTTTSALSRVCARFHTILVVGFDKRGAMLFELGYKADFGSATTEIGDDELTKIEGQIESIMDVFTLKSASLQSDDDEEVDDQHLFGTFDEDEYEYEFNRDADDFRLRSLSDLEDNIENKLSDKLAFLEPSCGDQSEIKAGCSRKGKFCSFRRIRTLDHNKGYENWKTSDNDLISFPQKISFDTRQPISGCKDYKCDELYLTGLDGTKRSLALRKGLVVRYNREFDKDGDGYFLTDQYGNFVRDINFITCTKTQNLATCVGRLEMIQYIRPEASVGQCEKANAGTNCLASPMGVFASENVYTVEYKNKDTLQSNPQKASVMNALKIGAKPDCNLHCAKKNCLCYQN